MNPHTWLSIKNAQVELESICNKVSAMDPANAAYYRANLESARSEFKALDERFECELASVHADKRYFVTTHAAFNYLADDYVLKQVAVTGILPEDEPSANQLATIADFVEQHGAIWPSGIDCSVFLPGGKTRGRAILPKVGEGETSVGKLNGPVIAAATKLGSRFMTENPARSFISRTLDDGSIEVLGVVAQSGRKTVNIRAKKAVVLASGGFDWNMGMMENYLRTPLDTVGALRATKATGRRWP